MPTSKAALIELGEFTPDEIKLCLQDTYSRSSISDPESEWKHPDKPTPLINPSATAAHLRSWREAWRNPKTEVAADPRNLVLVTVKVHRSLYEFDDEGNYQGTLSKSQIREWSEKIQHVFDGKDDVVLVESNAEEVKAAMMRGTTRRSEKPKKPNKGGENKKSTKQLAYPLCEVAGASKHETKQKWANSRLYFYSAIVKF